MTIKHDAILPYFECGPLIITLWPDKETYEFNNNTEIVIARDLDNIYKKRINLPNLIPRLQSDSLENALELGNVLTKPEIESLEKEKAVIIKYLKNCHEGNLDDS